MNHLFTSWNIARTVLVVTIVSAALFFLLGGFNEPTLRTEVRLTARLSGLLFSMTFIASSLFSIVHNSFTKWMMKNRKFIGVSFALVHLIHLALIIMLQEIFETMLPGTKLFTIAGGGIAYVFVVAMLFTSFPRFADRLSKMQWKWLHTAGAYWIWLVFLFSYLKRTGNDYVYLALSVFYVAALLIRLYGKRVRNIKLTPG